LWRACTYTVRFAQAVVVSPAEAASQKVGETLYENVEWPSVKEERYFVYRSMAVYSEGSEGVWRGRSNVFEKRAVLKVRAELERKGQSKPCKCLWQLVCSECFHSPSKYVTGTNDSNSSSKASNWRVYVERERERLMSQKNTNSG
jgi:hypothetical protein